MFLALGVLKCSRQMSAPSLNNDMSDPWYLLPDASCRTWPALALALHFNIHHQLYAPLFTNYMGIGDKDSYAMALLAMQMPYSLVQHRTGALAYDTHQCSWLTCRESLHTNTMVQHAPDGSIMFVHANMPPKWYLAVAADWESHPRRWTKITPGPDALVQSFQEVSERDLGCVSPAISLRLHMLSLVLDPSHWLTSELPQKACKRAYDRNKR